MPAHDESHPRRGESDPSRRGRRPGFGSTSSRGGARRPRTYRRSLGALVGSVPLLSSLALLSGTVAGAAAEPRSAGHVYVLNNDLSGANSITSFARALDGTL